MKTTGIILIASALLGLFTLSVQAVETKDKIVIVIQGGAVKEVSGYAIAGVPMEIVFHNQDTITHGFNSSLLSKDTKVSIEGGYHAEGMGPHVYRVDPLKTMILKFTAPQQGVGAMTYAFWCDMHRSVKGEMLIVEGK